MTYKDLLKELEQLRLLGWKAQYNQLLKEANWLFKYEALVSQGVQPTKAYSMVKPQDRAKSAQIIANSIAKKCNAGSKGSTHSDYLWYYRFLNECQKANATDCNAYIKRAQAVEQLGGLENILYTEFGSADKLKNRKLNTQNFKYWANNYDSRH